MLDSWGVVIGRFQTPELHLGHRDLFQTVADLHDNILVIVGNRPAALNANNPLPFLVRRQMILNHYPKAIVVPQTDMMEDQSWEKAIDTLIRSVIGMAPACLYTGRDSGIKGHYNGAYPVVELQLPHPELSASEVRQSIRPINEYSFRAGMVYAAQLAAPRLDMAVDMAVFNPEGQLLVGRKPNQNKMRLPGGMFDPGKDLNFRTAASREVAEETGILVHVATWEYAGDYNVDDWRVRADDGHYYHTMFFTATLPWHAFPKADDDLEWAGWVDPATLTPDNLVGEHVILVQALYAIGAIDGTQ